MTKPRGPRATPDLDDLIRLNQALDAQLRQLVQTEQRLFLSQRDLARQNVRLDALNCLAIEAAELASSEEILSRASETLFHIFAYEQCVAFLSGPGGALVPVVARSVPGREADSSHAISRERDAPLHGPLEIDLHAGYAHEVHVADAGASQLLSCLERVFREAVETGTPRAGVLVLPLVGRGSKLLGVMVLRRVTQAISVHEDLATKKDMAFLGVFARGASAALANAHLLHDLKVSYEQLTFAQRELVERERLAALGEFAAIVAHEVRNPLGAIGNAVAMLRRVAREPEAVGMLDIVTEESARLNQIVSDLIDFARPNPPAFQPDSIVRIMETAIETVLATLPGSTVVLRAEPDLPTLALDARMLRQAVVNLVVNAVQASRPGTEVGVVIAKEDGHVRIDVIDRGEGITPEVRARIFEPFYTTKATGTGLGLSVVKRAVDAHAGDVTATSYPGGGTTFSMRLPIR